MWWMQTCLNVYVRQHAQGEHGQLAEGEGTIFTGYKALS